MFKDFSTALSKYAVFTGRARRREFWHFMLASVIVTALVDGIYGDNGIFANLLELLLVVPTLAVAVRRLHDQGRSAWWLLLIPTGIGVFVLAVMMATPGQPYANEYGPDPKSDDRDFLDTESFDDWNPRRKSTQPKYRMEEDQLV